MPSAEAVSRKTGGWRYPVSWMTFPAPPGSCWSRLPLFLTSSGILTMNPKSPEHVSFSGNPREPNQHHVISISILTCIRWHYDDLFLWFALTRLLEVKDCFEDFLKHSQPPGQCIHTYEVLTDCLMNEWRVSSMRVHVAETAIKTTGSSIREHFSKGGNFFVCFAFTFNFMHFIWNNG